MSEFDRVVAAYVGDLDDRGRAVQFIVEEMLRAMAEAAPDGDALLAKLFERVSARIDRLLKSGEPLALRGEAIRAHVDRSFVQVARVHGAERDPK